MQVRITYHASTVIFFWRITRSKPCPPISGYSWIWWIIPDLRTARSENNQKLSDKSKPWSIKAKSKIDDLWHPTYPMISLLIFLTSFRKLKNVGIYIYENEQYLYHIFQLSLSRHIPSSRRKRQVTICVPFTISTPCQHTWVSWVGDITWLSRLTLTASGTTTTIRRLFLLSIYTYSNPSIYRARPGTVVCG